MTTVDTLGHWWRAARLPFQQPLWHEVALLVATPREGSSTVAILDAGPVHCVDHGRHFRDPAYRLLPSSRRSPVTPQATDQ
jgi:hypothetical protein